MESSLWRSRCRTTAWVNIGLTSLMALIFGANIVQAKMLGFDVSLLYFRHFLVHMRHINAAVEFDYTFLRWIYWGIIFLAVLLIITDIAAAGTILESTKRGVDLHTQLKQSQIWRKANIYFTIVIILFYLLIGGSVFPLFFQLLLRFSLLYSVTQFIEELREMIGSTSTSIPLEGVVTK